MGVYIAVMSSSRSEVTTQSVCASVRVFVRNQARVNGCDKFKRLTPLFITLLLIEDQSFPQNQYFASNILRSGEELDKLTKMFPESNKAILMSVLELLSPKKYR